MKTWLAVCMVFVMIAAWAGFGGLVYELGRERVAYAETVARAKDDAVRGESSARLRASVEGTEEERAALERLVNLTLLQAVEVIEQAGAAADIDAAIGTAVPADAPEGMTAFTLVVSGSGPFASVMRAVGLLETLPIPASLQDFQLVKDEREDVWRMSARVRVLLAAE